MRRWAGAEASAFPSALANRCALPTAIRRSPLTLPNGPALLPPRDASNSPASQRQLWPFAALSASYFAHVGFFNPYLSLWLQELGYGLVAISLFSSLQSATRVVAPYAWGWLSDHTGQRVGLLRYGASAAALLSLGLWWEPGPVLLFVVLLLMFSHTSAMMPMSEAAMAQLVSQGGVFDARRYGRVRLWGSLGFMFTVVLAGAWFDGHGLSGFPAWALGTLLALSASAWWLPNVREPLVTGAPRLSVWPVLREAPVRWLFASVFFHVLAHIFLYVFFSLYLDSLGYGKTAIGLFWAFSVLVEVAWFFNQGRWLPRLSLSSWLVLAAAVMALRMALTVGFAEVWWLLVLAQALHAISFAAHHTVCIALISEHFGGALRTRGQALYTVLAYGVPGVVGGALGGLVSEAYGLRSVYLLAFLSALGAVAAALRARYWRRQADARG